MVKKPLTLSVVVISWNQLNHLSVLIPQLLNQSYPAHEYEIVIVDDGSVDGSQHWIEEQKSSLIRAVISTEQRSRSAARNAGIIASKGKIIVMIDGDHTVESDFLSVHAARHSKEYCVVVGKSDFVKHRDFRALNCYLNNGGAAKLSSSSKLPGRYFLTRNCSVPRDLLLKVGLFDEKFTVWGGEDLDLGVRLEESGTPIYGEQRALAIHHHLRPLNDLLTNLYEYGYSGIPLLLEKHPKLFRELNLDRVLSNHYDKNRFSILVRMLNRLLMITPIYNLVKWIGNIFKRSELPRLIFDYLHLRQYTLGYVKYLKTRGSAK